MVYKFEHEIAYGVGVEVLSLTLIGDASFLEDHKRSSGQI
jgi:hypothetical protein